jgi:ferredoxin-type protein NapG
VPKGFNDKMHHFIKNTRNVTEMELEVLERFDAFEGEACTLCADMCPMPNPLSAIAMVSDEGGGQRPEIYEGCTGCGVCQEVCPTKEPSIVVLPRKSYDDVYRA